MRNDPRRYLYVPVTWLLRRLRDDRGANKVVVEAVLLVGLVAAAVTLVAVVNGWLDSILGEGPPELPAPGFGGD